jgi:hypothetical protein
MSQRYLIVNVRERQYISPEAFNDGPALMEFGASSFGAMLGLAVLLADGNDRGEGDLHSKHPIVGTWAGAPLVVAGEYADDGRLVPPADVTAYRAAVAGDADLLLWLRQRGYQSVLDYVPTLYRVAAATYEDISPQAIHALCDDAGVRKVLISERRIAAALSWPDGADPFSI